MTRPILEFVNIPLVNGFPPSHVRRQVRSHAAKAGGGSSGGGDDGNLENNDRNNDSKKHTSSSSSSPSSSHKAAAKRRKRYRHTLNWTFQVTTTQTTVEEVETEPELETTESTTTPESSQHFRARRQKGRSAARRRCHPHPTPPSSSSFLSGTAALIPASKSPVYHEPFVPVVLQHYLQHLAVAIPEVDGDGNTALLKTRWFPMVIHSPLLFQVIVLFSASHYAAQREDVAFAPTILLLKQRALAGIGAHVAASSSEGGTGTAVVRDELIAATAKMASYEAIWGDEHSYHCHMGGVEEMLKARGGGLASLGLDGFLARLLLFIDTNSAFLLNTYLHLRDSSFPRGEPFVLPNLSRFIGEI
ncbi:uncharacterized protein PV06_00974 [Exophiala oligosperma]|uniref:Uncharacterized protein n=2 Tax=Chaetothyriales TaxID=34395 RepID=A0A0D2E0Q6_9EURO|nr:uncharacterized protein PV06_00974 [Exophiala oligosperma]KAJ9633281.1 hypothetical protein H2204_007177 [Knufia peltigerae]KIW48380.1 hypothetical protein PV06_00974 [Exophiala oligosperma]